MTRFRRPLCTLPVAALAAAAGLSQGRLAAGPFDGCAPNCQAPACCTPGTGCGNECRPGLCDRLRGHCADGCGLFRRRTFAVPDTLPLGSTVRAHYHTMQTNAEASDFILHRYSFVDNTAELTPAGRDQIVEIAARAKSAPFPVVVERSEHNSDPELDALRRNLVAQILTDFGVPEANQRTFVAPGYGRNPNAVESEIDYYQFLYSQGNGFNNAFGNNGVGGAGFGGAGGGGFGF